MSVGPEFHINTTNFLDQHQVAVASQAAVNGRSVAVWTSVDEIGSNGQNIKAQLFDGAGNRIGGEINVAGTRFINESEPAVAMDAAGNFVVVWKEALTDSPDTDTMIRGQRFFSNGARNGFVMLLANDIHGKESDPDVAMNAASGDEFVVSYTVFNELPVLQPATASRVALPTLRQGYDVLARRFKGNGLLLGSLTVAGSSAPEHSSTVAASLFGFSVAYVVNPPVAGGGIGTDVQLKRYDSLGNLLTTHNIATSSKPEFAPDVAMDLGGNSVVVWQQVFLGSDHDIMARKVSSNGSMGNKLTIDSSFDYESSPTVAMDLGNDFQVPDGDFVVAYNRQRRTNGAVSGPVEVIVTEMHGRSRSSTNLGAVGSMPALSINFSDVFFLAYTSGDRADDPGLGIRGRRGQL